MKSYEAAEARMMEREAVLARRDAETDFLEKDPAGFLNYFKSECLTYSFVEQVVAHRMVYRKASFA